MALHFRLMINGTEFGSEFIAVRREADLGADIQNSVNAYDVEISGWKGTVKHRYGDGAWELVRKAMNEYAGAPIEDRGVIHANALDTADGRFPCCGRRWGETAPNDRMAVTDASPVTCLGPVAMPSAAGLLCEEDN